MVATIFKSAPPTAAPVIVPPAIWTKATSPAINALVPCTPLGVAITSTCNPYFLKMPASWAAHDGTIEPEIEVIAARILRNEVSAAKAGKLTARTVKSETSSRVGFILSLQQQEPFSSDR